MSQDILLEKLAAVRARQRNVAIGQGLARTALAVLALIACLLLATCRASMRAIRQAYARRSRMPR